MTKAGLASLIEADRPPSAVLGRLDRVLRSSGSVHTFTSLALVRLDPRSHQMVWSNAGHPFPLLAGRDGVRELEMPSLPLGKGPARVYEDVATPLEAGTSIVLCSDGVFEALDAEERPYGFERLTAAVRRLSGRSAEEIVAGLFDDWRSHIGANTVPLDDTTVVVIRRVG
jgi:sigma-B regulation protein RsbU (phosphoserine phosphatase)